MSVVAAIPRLGLRGHARSIAVGLSVGLFTVACAAALSRSQAHLYLGLLLAAVGSVYLGFGVADGRTSAIAMQAVPITVFLNGRRPRWRDHIGAAVPGHLAAEPDRDSRIRARIL
jgi:hypothetical protein